MVCGIPDAGVDQGGRGDTEEATEEDTHNGTRYTYCIEMCYSLDIRCYIDW